MPKVIQRSILGGVLGLFGLILAFGSFSIIPEGHVGIVKQFAKADRQIDTGLNFKIPIIESVEVIEVRQRKNVEELSAATANQLPISATVSVNWTVDKQSAADLFIEYGGLAQFEERILDPKLRSVAKASLSKFRADELIRERGKAVNEIQVKMTEAMEGFPVVVNSPQIENIILPTNYMESILAKEKAREDAEKEKHLLEQQRLQAQREVQTAEANKRAEIERATGQAEATRLKAQAEAEAIRLVTEQLIQSPDYIELVKAKNWNGVLPTTVLGSEGNVLFSVK